MNILKQSLLVIALMPVMANAVTPVGKQVTVSSIKLQGGSDSSADWKAPFASSFKVHVFVPKAGTLTNALYRVYPKGKRAGSTECLSTDTMFPCYEATIDQTLHQNAWTQLMVNNDPTTQWDFVKGKGYITAVASNLSAVELLNMSAFVRFEDTVRAIGKIYQGGIIFYVDNTGEHGLVAAPNDQSISIRWNNGTDKTTGATGIAIGTGLANTNKITNAQGAGAYAAKIAADLVLGGYSDWFLPSANELHLMYKNIGEGAAAPLRNKGGFAHYSYWSSSENDKNTANGIDFSPNSGVPFPNFSKINTFYVRAVRAF